METASLRIKFTPLIRDYQKNASKCCLEIVPEVTCIENLERIEWHQKSDFIEYTIPMTYKVILRKRQGAKESCHNLEKVYHSCVDLLPKSSSICISFGGGDNIIRMISDTLIYQSIRTTLDTDMVFTKNMNTELKSITNSNENAKEKQIEDNVVILGKYLDESSAETLSKNHCSIVKVDASTSQFLTNDASSLNKNYSSNNDSIDKIGCTSCSKIQLNKESKTEYDKTVTEFSSDISSIKVGSLRKLSITPIYSIEMIENEMTQTIPFLPPYPTLLKLQKKINGTVKIEELLDTKDDKVIKVMDNKLFNKSDYYSTDNSYRVYKRELPEIRVANFMKKMETEIMPLKIMLHDILQKCTTMGLMNESFRLREHSIANKQFIKYCTSEKQTKSNRVVYSIIFDG